jgi:hypothetical protein
MPENWASLLCFLKCSTQWEIIAGFGGSFYQGLKYPSVNIVLDRSGLESEEQNQIFADIQTIERGVLEVINQKD